jgi:hypothetical protein
VEVIFSGGVPLLWLLRGSAKNYTEFGLPVVHVFASALISVLAPIEFALYIVNGGRRRLAIPAFSIIWSIVIVSRGAVVNDLLQYALLWACLRGIRLKTLVRSAVVALLVVLMFGYVGDFRSGTNGSSESDGTFRNLARPTSDYPDWLPSGVLWAYVYVASPLGNLIQTTVSTPPEWDPFFPRTLLNIFPTPLRDAMFGKDYALRQGSGDLIESSLNVSSAYIGPFRDDGFWGMAAYSAVLALLSAAAWKRRSRSFENQVLYALVAQCLVLTIFWNFLFYNAFTWEFFWIFYLFRSGRFRLLPRLSWSSPSGTVPPATG